MTQQMCAREIILLCSLDPGAKRQSTRVVRTTFEQHLAQAMHAQNERRHTDALREVEAALALQPDNPHAHNVRGLIALDCEDAATAANHFAAATRADPAAAALWLNLAKAHRLAGDDEGERAALEAALETDQRHLMALIRIAELHERRGELPDATMRWAAVAALSSGYPDAPAELATIFEHSRRFVAERTDRLGASLAEELGSVLQSASERDRRRATAAIDHMLGRRPIYTNHCFGLHYPFLPADEFFDREHFPWLERAEAHTQAIREELLQLLSAGDAGLSPYVAMPPGTPANVWTELNNNRAWSALHLWKEGERIEDACARAPNTAKIVEELPLARIPGRAPTVFFSILKAGQHIPPHTGVTNTRAIIHLPLIVPEGCSFRVGGETREWREGEAFAFDDTIEHEAWNRSNHDRAVLIFDCWNPHLSVDEQSMICRLFAVTGAAKGL